MNPITDLILHIDRKQIEALELEQSLYQDDKGEQIKIAEDQLKRDEFFCHMLEEKGLL